MTATTSPPASPTPASALLTLNITGLQTQTDADNATECNEINGDIAQYRDWFSQAIPGQVPNTPMPTLIPWKVFNAAMGAALYSEMQAAAQGMRPGNNAFMVYDESMAIMNVDIAVPPNAASVSVGPTTHMPVFTYLATPTLAAPPADPIGAEIPGEPGWYYDLPNDPRGNGAEYPDLRGNFMKIVLPEPFMSGGFSRWLLVTPAPAQ